MSDKDMSYVDEMLDEISDLRDKLEARGEVPVVPGIQFAIDAFRAVGAHDMAERLMHLRQSVTVQTEGEIAAATERQEILDAYRELGAEDFQRWLYDRCGIGL